jgi:hypothetical protein
MTSRQQLLATILVLVAPLLYADPTTITYTVSTSPPDQVPQFCGNFQSCEPSYFYVPQFSGPGTLSAVTWTLTDNVAYFGGTNDLYDPLIGNPYTWTTTESDTSNLLGLDASNTQLNSGVTCGCGEISTGSSWSYTTIEAAGQAPDVNPFIGGGYLAIAVTPSLYASYPTSSNGWVEAALIEVSNDATLTVTYTDPVSMSAIPEPWLCPLLIGFCGVGLFWRRRTA